MRDYAVWAKSTPDALLRKKTNWVKAIDTYVTTVGASGVSTNTVSMVVRSMKKWLVANHAASKSSLVDVESVKVTTVEKDRTPTRAELQRIILGGDLVDRVLTLLAVATGLRVRAITYLRFSQIVGLELKSGKEVEVRVHRKDGNGVYRPVMTKFQSKELVSTREVPLVRIQAGINKVRRSHFTFLTPEAVEALRAYVVERQLRGEELTGDSLIVVTTVGKQRMSIATVEERWRNMLIRAKLIERSPGGKVKWYKLHFHTIRSYFTSACVLNGIEKEAAKFFRGDRGGALQGYVMKQDDEEIPKATMEKAEELYRKALPDLTLTSERKGTEKEEMLAEMRRQLLLFVRYTPEEVGKMGDLSAMPQQQFDKLLDKKRDAALGLHGNTQKVVPTEVKSWILQGWEFTSQLPGQEAFIRLPGPLDRSLVGSPAHLNSL